MPRSFINILTSSSLLQTAQNLTSGVYFLATWGQKRSMTNWQRQTGNLFDRILIFTLYLQPFSLMKIFWFLKLQLFIWKAACVQYLSVLLSKTLEVLGWTLQKCSGLIMTLSKFSVVFCNLWLCFFIQFSEPKLQWWQRSVEEIEEVLKHLNALANVPIIGWKKGLAYLKSPLKKKCEKKVFRVIQCVGC